MSLQSSGYFMLVSRIKKLWCIGNIPSLILLTFINLLVIVLFLSLLLSQSNRSIMCGGRGRRGDEGRGVENEKHVMFFPFIYCSYCCRYDNCVSKQYQREEGCTNIFSAFSILWFTSELTRKYILFWKPISNTLWFRWMFFVVCVVRSNFWVWNKCIPIILILRFILWSQYSLLRWQYIACGWRPINYCTKSAQWARRNKNSNSLWCQLKGLDHNNVLAYQ